MIGELQSITVARGLAVWLLVMAVALAPHIAPALLGFLFLLSGFTVYLSAQSSLRRSGFDGVLPFLWRRCARLTPGFAAAVLLVLVARNVTLLGDLLPAALAMLLATILFPLLVLLSPFARLRRPDLLGLMMVAVALIQPVDRFIPDPLLHELVRLLLLWTAGAILCAFWLRGPDGDPRALLLSLAGFAGTALLWACDLADPHCAASALSMFLIQSLAHASAFRRNPLHQRSLLWLGRTSYTAWLAHLPIAAAVLPTSDPLVTVGYLLGALSATMLLSLAAEQMPFKSLKPAPFPRRRLSAR